ncbi:DUF5004 domain-containing protein [Allomuricauda sp.]|uniref:DUF5004 domain-containing protein n=1 Tax=Flagellimonas sp. TaxID=2058762 RepID=UPI001B1F319E|nr:DUF5004 domain-containing protein [Allomuricauda sp.]MBO6830874.1 DUF5004 domain-containing protein [Allomuricauda sp.]
MKKTTNFLLCLASIALLTACSDDDGNGSGFSADALVGTWDLTAVNVSSQLDLDDDGTSSANLIDEQDCISGTITFNADNTYQFQQSNFTITTITNGQYFVDCNGSIQATGAWASDGTQVVFQGSTTLGTLQLNGNQMILNEGQDLPDVRSYVYVKR